MLQRMLRLPTKMAYLVSSQRKVDQKTRDYILPRSRRAGLAEAARLAASQGLACGTLSELSARLPGDRMAISAAETWFAHAGEDDFTVASLIHDHLIVSNPLPAAHTAWHRLVYQSTPAGAVLLCQPRSVLQCLHTPLSLDPALLPDAFRTVKTVVWAAPDADAVARASAGSPVIVVQGVGLLVWAANAFAAAALAENASALLWLHCTIGNK